MTDAAVRDKGLDRRLQPGVAQLADQVECGRLGARGPHGPPGEERIGEELHLQAQLFRALPTPGGEAERQAGEQKKEEALQFGSDN